MPRHSIIFRSPEKVSLCFREDFFSVLIRNYKCFEQVISITLFSADGEIRIHFVKIADNLSESGERISVLSIRCTDLAVSLILLALKAFLHLP